MADRPYLPGRATRRCQWGGKLDRREHVRGMVVSGRSMVPRRVRVPEPQSQQDAARGVVLGVVSGDEPRVAIVVNAYSIAAPRTSLRVALAPGVVPEVEAKLEDIIRDRPTCAVHPPDETGAGPGSRAPTASRSLTRVAPRSSVAGTDRRSDA